jgi:DNA-directed RNA polymerase beta subunit
MDANHIYKVFQDTLTTHLERESWTGEDAIEKEAASFVVKDDDVGADEDTILAASEKILAVNRGLTDPDERDSLIFRTMHPVDKLIEERIDLDANGILRKTMRRLARAKNLSALGVNQFDNYTESLITKSELSMPLEEINPMHLVEQARRVTQMGPGGLPSDQSITEEAQNLHPSEFGFLSALEGPESGRIGVDTRMSWGTKMGNDGRVYQRFLNKRTGGYEWLSPTDMSDKVIELPD